VLTKPVAVVQLARRSRRRVSCGALGWKRQLAEGTASYVHGGRRGANPQRMLPDVDLGLLGEQVAEDGARILGGSGTSV
jgi:hypothetical protein